MLDKPLPIIFEPAPAVSPFDDPECRYLAMPESMRTFTPPARQDWREAPGARDVLSRLGDGLSACLAGGKAPTVSMIDSDPATRACVEQILGEGEIRVLGENPDARLVIVESVFTGIWAVKRYRNGILEEYYLETGSHPEILARWSAAKIPEAVWPSTYPVGLMNAPALIHEIFHKAAQPGGPAEDIINLTLLPLAPEDMAFLRSSLGLAGLSILAKGYGDCQISRTQLPNVWWVQYFNSTSQLILNTLEITPLPRVVMAAREDLEDSLTRLTETLSVMQPLG